MRRCRWIAAVAVTLGVFAPFVSAQADADDAAALLSALNASRRDNGVGEVAPASDLDGVAAAHAQAMADRQSLFHNPNLGSQVTNWLTIAENVGVGNDVASLHQAFLNSSAHRTNILDGRLTEVGIGVVWAAERIWVVQVFRQPNAAAAPAPAASKKPVRVRPVATAAPVVVQPPTPPPVEEPVPVEAAPLVAAPPAARPAAVVDLAGFAAPHAVATPATPAPAPASSAPESGAPVPTAPAAFAALLWLRIALEVSSRLRATQRIPARRTNLEPMPAYT